MTSFRVTKAPCVKLPVVLGGLMTAVIMGLATRQPKPALVIQHGLGPPVTSQTVPVPLTAMVEASVSHPRTTMKHRGVIALKDGWVLPVSYRVNMELQQAIIYACVTRATMGLPVTCSALITLHSVLMTNVIVDLRVGEETTAKGRVVLGIRKIAQDTGNVCLLEHVFVIQDGVVMAVSKQIVQENLIVTIEASASRQKSRIAVIARTDGQGLRVNFLASMAHRTQMMLHCVIVSPVIVD